MISWESVTITSLAIRVLREREMCHERAWNRRIITLYLDSFVASRKFFLKVALEDLNC